MTDKPAPTTQDSSGVDAEIDEILERLSPYTCTACVRNAPPDHVHTINVNVEARSQIKDLITRARIEEVRWMRKQIPKKVKGVNYGTPETNPHGWAYETYIEAWKPVLKDRIATLKSTLKEGK